MVIYPRILGFSYISFILYFLPLSIFYSSHTTNEGAVWSLLGFRKKQHCGTMVARELVICGILK